MTNPILDNVSPIPAAPVRPPGLPALPTELVDMILEYLPPESAVALALTCRVLFVKHFLQQQQQRKLSRPARAKLLLRLERDVPALYYCHDCEKLHAWNVLRRCCAPPRVPFRTGIGPYQANRPDPRLTPDSMVSYFGERLTYTWARLAVNRHLYGELHGPPLRNIEGVRRWRDGNVVVTASWRAKFIGKSLYVHGTAVLQGWGKKAEELGHFLQRYRRRLVCNHLDWAMSEPGFNGRSCYPSAFEVVSGPRGDDLSRAVTTLNSIRSCPICFTDYRLCVVPMPGTVKGREQCLFLNEDGAIEVDQWCKLGACRSPYDGEWFNRVSCNGWMQRKKTGRPGTVYRNWAMEESRGSAHLEGTARFARNCEAGGQPTIDLIERIFRGL